MLTTELDTPYELAGDAVERFRHDGFVHLRDVLSAGNRCSIQMFVTCRKALS